MEGLQYIKFMENILSVKRHGDYPTYDTDVSLPNHLMTTTGYEPVTELWKELSEAETKEADGLNKFISGKAEELRSDHVRYTELTLFLNWKIWDWHGRGCDDYARLYDTQWKAADGWAMDNLTGEAMDYYIKTTD